MALNVNIIGKDSEGNLRALKVNSEGNLDLGQLETEIQAVKDNQGRLYGKYGEAWIPVKVDSEGRPIIASDVTVNMEGLVIDVGEQLDLADRPNRELGKVSLSGTVPAQLIRDYTLEVELGGVHYAGDTLRRGLTHKALDVSGFSNILICVQNLGSQLVPASVLNIRYHRTKDSTVGENVIYTAPINDVPAGAFITHKIQGDPVPSLSIGGSWVLGTKLRIVIVGR